MTTVAIQRHTAVLSSFFNTGMSEAARNLQRIYSKDINRLRASETWNRLRPAFATLKEIYQECAEKDWDGYGALPISHATYYEARRFLDALPSWLPAPEIEPEPEGNIGFEWNFGKTRVLVASVNGTNRITYAGLLGAGNKTCGTEIFDGSIPQTFIDYISRIRPRSETTAR